jgi:hypothetical protein
VTPKLRGERPTWLVLALITAGGALAGIAAKIADESPITGMADLGTSPTVWVLALAVIARFAPTPVHAAIRAAAFFIAMCIGYYAWTSLKLGYPGSGPLLVGWLALAVTVVPIGAAVIRWSCDRSGAVAAVVLAGAGGIALADPRVRQLWYAATGDLPSDFPLRPIQGVVAIAAALVITLWLPRHHATRAWAGALLLPMTFVVVAVLDAVGGGLLPS